MLAIHRTIARRLVHVTGIQLAAMPSAQNSSVKTSCETMASSRRRPPLFPLHVQPGSAIPSTFLLAIIVEQGAGMAKVSRAILSDVTQWDAGIYVAGKRQLAIIRATAPLRKSRDTSSDNALRNPWLRVAMELAAPPSDALFPSREALLAHVRDFVEVQGYAVVVHKANVSRGKLWLRCDLGGVRRRTRLHDCPFQLYARRLPSGEWKLKVQNAMHHHEPESQHPVARRLACEHKRVVLELTDEGLRPAQILERLKEQFPGKPFAVKEIYNERNFIRRERLAGRVPFAGEQEEADDQLTETMASAAAVPVVMQESEPSAAEGAESSEQSRTAVGAVSEVVQQAE